MIRSVLWEHVRNVILPRRMLLIVCFFFFDSLMTNIVCNLDGDTTCWHRQRPRDRIQFCGAAVPVSWFVEPPEFVLLSRTRIC